MPVISGSGSGSGSGGGSEVGYDQITTSVTVTSTTESAGDVVITASAHTFDGSPVMVEFYSALVESNHAVGGMTVLSLFEGLTQITRLAAVENFDSNAAIEVPLRATYRFTPSAGSHTYKVTAFTNSAVYTPVVTAGSGGTGGWPPAFLRFTKV